MEYSKKTDIGRHRDLNEDSVYAEEFEGYHLFIVADGMGGHLAGEVASQLAIDSVEHYVSNNFLSEDDKLQLVNEAMLYANSSINKKSNSDPQYSNMGTTCDTVLYTDGTIYIGHVGDSRVYLYRDGEVKQLTRDHSLINDLIESGSLTIDEAKKNKQRNIITRALGGEYSLVVDLHKYEILNGDIILLCSDGLTNGVDDESIKSVLMDESSTADKSNKLIELSNASGGYDNSSVVVAEKR